MQNFSFDENLYGGYRLILFNLISHGPDTERMGCVMKFYWAARWYLQSARDEKACCRCRGDATGRNLLCILRPRKDYEKERKERVPRFCTIYTVGYPSHFFHFSLFHFQLDPQPFRQKSQVATGRLLFLFRLPGGLWGIKTSLNTLVPSTAGSVLWNKALISH